MTYPHQPNDHQTEQRQFSAPKLLTNGAFRASLNSHGLEETTNGKPFYRVTWRLLEGPDEGQTISWKGFLVGGATEFTVKTMRAMGWTGDDLDRVAFGVSEAVIRLQDRTYEGRTKTEVRGVQTGAPVGNNSHLPPEKRKALSSMVAKELRALDALNPEWKQNAAKVAESPAPAPVAARVRTDTDRAPAPKGIGPAPVFHDTRNNADNDGVEFDDDIPF